ncbi:MAG TPA: hypothetical protein VMT18_11525, partial [Planctomycetota bacterium]|nr:hypothetical protein [Planctomycetota bacterium]
GGSVEVELDALAAHAVGVALTWEGRPLPGALVRLSADRDAFRAPHADARTFLTGPAVRADAKGLADLGALHGGVVALRVEHPDVPGFARALLAVGESGVRALELAPDRLRGEVLRDGERVQQGRVVVWAHGAFHEDGLELAAGDVLRELMPSPLVLAEVELVGGTFDVAVPPGVELIVTADTGLESGDYFVAVPEGRREPIQVHVERSLELSIAPDLRGKRSRTRELGVVGVHRTHPWGRGLFHARLEDDELRVGDLPPGRWHLCLVELAGGQLVLEAGAWRQYDLEGGRKGVRLAWRAP